MRRTLSEQSPEARGDRQTSTQPLQSAGVHGDSDSQSTKKRRKQQHSRSEEEKKDEFCVICFLERPSAALLCCGTKTHISCMSRWQQTQGQAGSNCCPNCRSEFDEPVQLPSNIEGFITTLRDGGDEDTRLGAILSLLQITYGDEAIRVTLGDPALGLVQLLISIIKGSNTWMEEGRSPPLLVKGAMELLVDLFEVEANLRRVADFPDIGTELVAIMISFLVDREVSEPLLLLNLTTVATATLHNISSIMDNWPHLARENLGLMSRLTPLLLKANDIDRRYQASLPNEDGSQILTEEVDMHRDIRDSLVGLLTNLTASRGPEEFRDQLLNAMSATKLVEGLVTFLSSSTDSELQIRLLEMFSRYSGDEEMSRLFLVPDNPQEGLLDYLASVLDHSVEVDEDVRLCALETTSALSSDHPQLLSLPDLRLMESVVEILGHAKRRWVGFGPSPARARAEKEDADESDDDSDDYSDDNGVAKAEKLDADGEDVWEDVDEDDEGDDCNDNDDDDEMDPEFDILYPTENDESDEEDHDDDDDDYQPKDFVESSDNLVRAVSVVWNVAELGGEAEARYLLDLEAHRLVLSCLQAAGPDSAKWDGAPGLAAAMSPGLMVAGVDENRGTFLSYGMTFLMNLARHRSGAVGLREAGAGPVMLAVFMAGSAGIRGAAFGDAVVAAAVVADTGGVGGGVGGRGGGGGDDESLSEWDVISLEDGARRCEAAKAMITLLLLENHSGDSNSTSSSSGSSSSNESAGVPSETATMVASSAKRQIFKYFTAKSRLNLITLLGRTLAEIDDPHYALGTFCVRVLLQALGGLIDPLCDQLLQSPPRDLDGQANDGDGAMEIGAGGTGGASVGGDMIIRYRLLPIMRNLVQVIFRVLAYFATSRREVTNSGGGGRDVPTAELAIELLLKLCRRFASGGQAPVTPVAPVTAATGAGARVEGGAKDEAIGVVGLATGEQSATSQLETSMVGGGGDGKCGRISEVVEPTAGDGGAAAELMEGFIQGVCDGSLVLSTVGVDGPSTPQETVQDLLVSMPVSLGYHMTQFLWESRSGIRSSGSDSGSGSRSDDIGRVVEPAVGENSGVEALEGGEKTTTAAVLASSLSEFASGSEGEAHGLERGVAGGVAGGMTGGMTGGMAAGVAREEEEVDHEILKRVAHYQRALLTEAGRSWLDELAALCELKFVRS